MGKIETNISEAELIKRAQRNPNAFAPLYEKYYEQIFRFVFKRTQRKELSADLVSQVFMKALMNINKYEDRGFPLSSWLYRIALNECNLHFRKASKYHEVELGENQINSLLEEVNDDDSEDRRKYLIAALNLLNFEEVSLLEMRFFEGRRYKEIGEILGITEDNAKMKIYRIVKKLRNHITEIKT